MKQQSLTFLTILLLGTTLSCHKDTETLPQATQAGKGVFACMYDGKVLTIAGAYAGYYNNAYNFNRPNISIVADNSPTSDPKIMYIGLNRITSPGVYLIGKDGIGIEAILNTDSLYDRYESFSGTIELTVFDTINHLISGKFNAEMVLSSGGGILQGKTSPIFKDTISIRSGRFDLPLSVHNSR